MKYRTIVGDCRVVMAAMESDSVDAIVCDPPYDLLSVSRNGSGRSNLGSGPYGRFQGAGGFMGMKWDGTGVAFDPETWCIAKRVLKPGGHLVAFGGTRTFHRLTCAIEDAGFEVRDVLSWLYGSGFPKSLDVSKALDKAAGAEREVVGPNRYAGRNPRADHSRQGAVFADDAYVRPVDPPRTTPATSEAQEWSGWGTALKPAWEPIVLARKPLSEPNVAANVLRWGTGALNVDGCRIALGDEQTPTGSGDRRNGAIYAQDEWTRTQMANGGNTTPPSGRWPANVVLDEEAADLLNRASGESSSTIGKPRGSVEPGNGWGMTRTGAEYADSGGASRFFYTAKASQSERNERIRQVGGTNSHPTVKPVDLMRWLCRMVTRPGGHILDPFVGSGSTLVAALLEGFDATGIDLSPEYITIARARIDGIQIGGLL